MAPSNGNEDLRSLLCSANALNDATSVKTAKQLTATTTNFGQLKLEDGVTKPNLPATPATEVKSSDRSMPKKLESKLSMGNLSKTHAMEAMVPKQWWKTLFDALYLATDGDVVEDPDVTREEIAMLEKDSELQRIFSKGCNGVDAPAKVLDLCCGQGRHSLFLAQKYSNLKLFGHDQSSFLIDIGNQRAASAKVSSQVNFTIGDCRQIPYPDGQFDLVLLMGNSFGYFGDESEDKAVLTEIYRVLAPGGRVVMDVADGEYMRQNFAERSWEWIDKHTFVCRERQLSDDTLRLITREIIISTKNETNRGVVRDQFYQERLYRRDELEAMAKDTGLLVQSNILARESKDTNVSSLTVVEELSKRQEDLGMMGHRMLVKVFKPENDTTIELINSTQANMISKVPATNSEKLFDKIIVVMGDPSQPCVGKLNNTWNEEDFITRRKLFEALINLGYIGDSLQVLESHKSLHSDLSKIHKQVTNSKAILSSGMKPYVVFNLCDEGYDNDAMKELHVPSLLEMLHIPYSGAGPNCLAFCYDKGLVNRSAEAIGIPTPKEVTFLSDVPTPSVPDLSYLHVAIEAEIGYPAFIKPIRGDNSLGITPRSVVYDRNELEAYVVDLQRDGIKDVVVQQYLEGTEYSVGMIGNLDIGFHFFPVLSPDYSKIISRNLPPILGFESKWDPTSPYWSEISYVRANLSEDVLDSLKKRCVALWQRFACRDYARFDFRCDRGKGDGFDGLGGTIKLLEVNPNPGWCWDGKFSLMCQMDGMNYTDMLGMILKACHSRLG